MFSPRFSLLWLSPLALGLLFVNPADPFAALAPENDPAPAAETLEDPAEEAPPEFKIPEEEQPFWDSAQAFLDAYNKRDLEAISDMFTETAQIVTEDGETIEGREAIKEIYQQIFEDEPNLYMDEIQVQKVRMINKTVAVEEGITWTLPSSTTPRTASRYVAVHKLEEDGKWRVDLLKDFNLQGLDRVIQLEQLSWLIGSWVNESGESVVDTHCDWSEDGNYLLYRWSMHLEGYSPMTGEQRIGWDPIARTIRSWTFDSEGGFLEGTWTRNGHQWLVTSRGFNSAGDPVSSVAVYTLIDTETITWELRSLVIGNDLQEVLEPILMVKSPPAPKVDEVKEQKQE